MEETPIVDRVRLVMLAEAKKSHNGKSGTVESPLGSNNVKYNTAFYCKAPQPCKEVNGPNFKWCCTFIWYCMRRAGIDKSVFPKVASVFKAPNANVRDFFKARNRFLPAATTPKVGDLVIFKFSHIGFVESVSPTQIKTVEGNVNSRVVRLTHARNSNKIDGYCRPAYKEADVTKDELLDALESERGQKALRSAVTHVLRQATGPDDASQPAGVWFDSIREDIKDIKHSVG